MIGGRGGEGRRWRTFARRREEEERVWLTREGYGDGVSRPGMLAG